MVFLSVQAGFVFAQPNEVTSDWIQYPPKLSPRASMNGSFDGKNTWLQYPPPKSAELGTKSSPTYKGGTQTVVVRYTDGTSNELTQKATSQEVSWADDHVTKTITYKFKDGTTHTEVARVKGMPRTPVYLKNKKIETVDYGDGSTSIVTTLAVDERTAWTDDRQVKISTYTFPDGYIHQEIAKFKLIKAKSTYEKNVQTLVKSYEDGSSEKQTFNAVQTNVQWSNDHVTKKTIYKFPDGSINSRIEKIEPVLSLPKYEGDIQIIIANFGDGFIKVQKNKSIREIVKWGEDRKTKDVTYIFSNGAEHSDTIIVEPLLIAETVEGDKKFISWKYGDGKVETITYASESKSETWLDDHISKKITYKFADGKINTVVEKQAPIKSKPTYSAGVQLIFLSYADGFTETQHNKATNETVSWSSDNVKKTTTYKFADGSTSKESIDVAPKVSEPTYAKGMQTIKTTYGNGKTAIQKSYAVSEDAMWSQDHLQKTTNYKFADGSVAREVETVLGIVAKSTYEKDVQSIVTKYGDGVTTVKKNTAVSQSESWEADHITRKTVYTFEDGTKNTWIEKIEPALSEPRYQGREQTIQKLFGDGHKQAIVNQAVKEFVKWDEDRVKKTVTYVFADKTENSEVSRQDPSIGKATYDGVVQSKIVKYADGSELVVKSQPVSSKVEWLADHITRKTHNSYADGGVNTVTEKIMAKAGKPTYMAELQRVEVVYGDGFVEIHQSKAVDTKVTWAADHITKKSVYWFKDGTSSEEVESVPPVVSAVTYKNGEQTVKTSFGDGKHSSTVNSAIKQEENWSKAKTQRQITYEFADGSKHIESFILNSEGQLINVNDATKPSATKKLTKFPVTGFEFEGNTKFTSAQLSELLNSWIRDEVDFEVLKNAATVISNKYRESGFLAKTEIPQQDVTGGIVNLHIVESKLSAVMSENSSNKTTVNELALGIVETSHKQGEIVDLDKLDKAAMILSEIPGVQADLSLRSGERSGETLAVVQLSTVKPVDGSVTLDNAGARSTGYERVVAQINVSGAVNRGEQLVLQMLHSKGVDFAKVAYSEPIGFNGLRLGINASEMKYQVIASEMLALNAHGPASTRGLDLNAPIVRTQYRSLSLQITLDDKKFGNETFSGLQSKYTGKMLGINMQGSSYDNYGEGGLNTLGMLLVSGDMNFDGSPNKQADLYTTQTAGNFNKFKFSLGRQQKLDSSTAFVVNYQTQLASKNLDGSEKLYLGGSQGVRAYAANEAGGSIGQILSVELQRQSATEFGQMSMAAFADIGHITVNKFNSYPSAFPLNDYTLRGAGLWVGLNSTNRFGGGTYRLTWSRRLGSNPAASVLGLDQDGTFIRNRFWLSANQYF